MQLTRTKPIYMLEPGVAAHSLGGAVCRRHRSITRDPCCDAVITTA
eukprot:COSAG05_NODE_25875_length_192_cov_2019.064516_1_plen_45_part_01